MNVLRKILRLFALLLFVASLAAGAYFWKQAEGFRVELDNLRNDPEFVARQEVRSIVDEVGKLVVLPEDESPVIATVSDKDQLADVPFFAKAENGDKVLIYPKARKIYLYDPDVRKLLEVAPLNIGQQEDLDEVEGESTPTPEPALEQEPTPEQ